MRAKRVNTGPMCVPMIGSGVSRLAVWSADRASGADGQIASILAEMNECLDDSGQLQIISSLFINCWFFLVQWLFHREKRESGVDSRAAEPTQDYHGAGQEASFKSHPSQGLI